MEMLQFKTRDEVAKEFNYKNSKSLDTYMRRRNFRYDSKSKQYVPVESRNIRSKSDPKTYAPVRVAEIITAFEKADADPRTVAEQAGFTDHKQMADYMKTMGYVWSAQQNNYVKEIGKIEDMEDETKNTVINLPQAFDQSDKELQSEMEKCLPLIRYLYENRNRVYQLISGTQNDGRVPRYAVPGRAATKAMYMSYEIANLVVKYSREKNIKQKDIVEVAFIEFLYRYDYKHEVDTLLKSS